MNEDMIEKCCRAICDTHNIDPDGRGYGIGQRMPEGSEYPLWEAQRKTVEIVITMLKDIS